MFVLLSAAVFSRSIKLTPILASGYEVQGIDVSHYQGSIDWKTIESQNIDFAFIKATEGSGLVDENFSENWKNAAQTSVLSGAYHFFSFDSSPKTQAELYIKTVGELDGRLPPVVDVEFYADNYKAPPSRGEVIADLSEFISELSDYYGTNPIIYTTYSVYNRYIRGNFNDDPLWIRNVYYKPIFFQDTEWSFWQYSDTEKLDGCSGEEEFIDRNVFNGSKTELEKLLM